MKSLQCLLLTLIIEKKIQWKIFSPLWFFFFFLPHPKGTVLDIL